MCDTVKDAVVWRNVIIPPAFGIWCRKKECQTTALGSVLSWLTCLVIWASRDLKGGWYLFPCFVLRETHYLRLSEPMFLALPGLCLATSLNLPRNLRVLALLDNLKYLLSSKDSIVLLLVLVWSFIVPWDQPKWEVTDTTLEFEYIQ